MYDFLKALGINRVNAGATTGAPNGWLKTGGEPVVSCSPIDGQPIATVIQATAADYEDVVSQAQAAFRHWRMLPAPKRGLVVREIGEALRAYKEPLGKLVTLEMGKTVAEGCGEVQEMIDMADFSVGLSRQLYGLAMHSERPQHRMYEQWHPLGIVSVITAFNFPVAVWSWNALLAATCGDVILWKPSSKTPLTAIAVHNIIAPVVAKYDLAGVFTLIIGHGRDIGEKILHDARIPLVSMTGSTRMGRRVSEVVGQRLGRSLLELGGNNAILIAEDADLDLALRAVVFGAVGTAGQRCTSTRRLIIHQSVKTPFLKRLIHAYRQLPIGNPLDEKVLMGPLVDAQAGEVMQAALAAAKQSGGRILYGGERVYPAGCDGGYYVQPAIVEAPPDLPIMREETFAPILYVVEYNNFDEAVALHNDVRQGLSSAIFTRSLHYSEQFLSHAGSDCGIANVNIGTSGAEIGGAFGGEKETGGGRESGSDAWKLYMRRQTNTVNWGKDLPLAQGINFDIAYRV
ncbi:MAG: aldehyde dehydrogenase family protein [Deltaproteobacteria bacterium]|nr:aldehyde dehydrogenase family protein [Deltaproteobacteria bacterium]